MVKVAVGSVWLVLDGLSMTLYELQGFPGLSWMGRGSLWEKVEEQMFGIAVEVGSLLQAPVARQPGINNMYSTFHTRFDILKT